MPEGRDAEVGGGSRQRCSRGSSGEFDGAGLFVRRAQRVFRARQRGRAFLAFGVDPGEFGVQRHETERDAAFDGFGLAGMIDQQAAHEARREGVKVRAIMETHFAHFDETLERFVDERSALQGVIGTLVAEERFGGGAAGRKREAQGGRRRRRSPSAQLSRSRVISPLLSRLGIDLRQSNIAKRGGGGKRSWEMRWTVLVPPVGGGVRRT